MMDNPEGKQKRQRQVSVSVTSSSPNKRPRKSVDNPAMNLNVEGDDEEDYFPITVEEKSFCNSDGTTLSLMKYLHVDLLSHCIYCLRKTQASESSTGQQACTDKDDDDPMTLLTVVPRAQVLSTSSSSLLSTFNQTWSYISTMGSGRDEEDDLLNLEDFSGDKNKAEFFELPRVCDFCAEKLNSLDTLFRDLKFQLDALGRITQESKYGGKHSWRAEQFERTLKGSRLDTDVIEDTFHILNNLGKSSADLNEGGNDPKFPTSASSHQQKLGEETECVAAGFSGIVDDDNTKGVQDPLDEDGDQLSDNSVVYVKSEPEEDSDEEEEIEVGSLSESAISIVERSAEARRFAENKSASLQYPITPVVKMKPPVPTQICDLCKAAVPTTDILEHVRAHVGDEYLFPCPAPKCPNVYSNSKTLYKHLKGGKGKKRCRELEFIPNVEQVLEKVRASASVCQVCGRKYRKLRIHLQHIHESPIKQFPCPIANCSQRFSVKQSVELHIPQHDLRSTFNTQNCPNCNGRWKIGEMEEHLKRSHGVDEAIKCNRCPYLFSTREQLVDHLFVHRHGLLTCDICGDAVKFPEHHQLREHYFKEHQVGKQYVCQHCNRVYLTEFKWKEHSKRHTSVYVPPPTKEYKCDACDAVFKGDGTLRDHKIKEHGADPYCCKFCNEVFSRHELLRIHVKEHREGPREEKPEPVFVCEEEGCGKNFTSKKKLEHHISTGHLGIRAFVCDLCGMSYKTRSGLVSHRNSVHLNLRPHVCQTCGESFMAKNVLELHQMIHTGERPFACEICGQRFRHKTVLKTHVEGHQKKGADFKPNGPMKKIRKRTKRKTTVDG